MRRRHFMAVLGGAGLAWPLAALAQQVPVIGYLATSNSPTHPSVAGFRRGLREGGFEEGRNIVIEYRWAESHYDRLPAMAADLVRRPVSLILAQAPPAALAAKAATATIP